jgi:transmembrane sensor
LPGETQKVTLDDGSILHINTNSSLQYSSSESRREDQLYSGEVLVEVAKDPQRPFSVRAGQVTTTALGTIFSVRMRSNETVVMVTHGSVQFEPSDRIKAEEALLEAGDVASVEFSGSAPRAEIVSVEPELLSQKLAWKDGLLIFDGDPLTEVIDEVTRYTDTSVVISDPSLREIPIGGVFRIGEVSPFIGALESSFGIEAEYVDPNTVYLRRIE